MANRPMTVTPSRIRATSVELAAEETWLAS